MGRPRKPTKPEEISLKALGDLGKIIGKADRIQMPPDPDLVKQFIALYTLVHENIVVQQYKDELEDIQGRLQMIETKMAFGRRDEAV